MGKESSKACLKSVMQENKFFFLVSSTEFSPLITLVIQIQQTQSAPSEFSMCHPCPDLSYILECFVALHMSGHCISVNQGLPGR